MNWPAVAVGVAAVLWARTWVDVVRTWRPRRDEGGMVDAYVRHRAHVEAGAERSARPRRMDVGYDPTTLDCRMANVVADHGCQVIIVDRPRELAAYFIMRGGRC